MAKRTISNVVEMETVLPKKKVVRFQTDDDKAAISNVYISNELVEQLGGCEDGVRITIEAL